MKRVIILLIALTAVALCAAVPVDFLFESFDSNSTIPVGWNTIVESQSSTSNVWLHTSEYDAHSGTNFVKMLGDIDNNQDYLMLVTPELTQLSNNQLSFYSKSSWGNVADSIRVGSMTDPTDRNTFSELAIFQLTNVYQEFTLDFSADNSDNYIAFMHMPAGDVGYSVYVDDVSWESNAVVPNAATAINPVDGDVNVLVTYSDHGLQFPLNWSANGGNPTEYIINVGSDFPPTNIVSNLSLGTATEYSITEGLDYLTAYYWQVIPANEFGQATDCPIWSFITMSNTGVDFNVVNEYTQGFETSEVGWLPLGWEYENLNNDSSWWETIGSSATSNNAHTGTQAVHIRFGFTSAHDDWMYTPAMNLRAGVTYTISFWYKNSPFQTSVEKMNVFVGDSPESSAMTTQLWDNNIVNTEYVEATMEYIPTEAGIKFFGWHAYSDAIQMVLLVDDISISQDDIVANDNDIAVLTDLSLSNYPNPFNPETTISFSIPQNQVGSLKIYNLKGQLVKQFNNLTSNDRQVVWNGRNDNNKEIPSGIYLTKLIAGSSHLVKKVTLLK